jgi:hypothetical protein
MFGEKRTEILYVRVKKSNKDFVETLSEKNGVSESVAMDYLLDEIKSGSFKIKLGKEDASNKKPSKRSPKKV